MLTRTQRMQVEGLFAMCKTEEGLRKVRLMNKDEEFEGEFRDTTFDAWIRFCKEMIEREGL